jgi:group II intron reverse transcriptase/maturase
MVRMLEERIDDRAFMWLIKKWLKAGILETDGRVQHPATGTPQGGIVSPILSNIYLHYALDLWFHKVNKRNCRGEACLIRYADDYVCAFQVQAEAESFYRELSQRLKKFGLTLSEEKSHIIPFSRYRPAESGRFDFLGFEFWWGRDRAGKDHLKRRTSRKKLRSSLRCFTAWCKENRNFKLKILFNRLNAKLRGYYNYYGVCGNSVGLSEFFFHAMRILYKWLNRRSQRRSYNWAGFRDLLDHFEIERPWIVGRPKTRRAASKA